jgi:hypothetical protein
LTILQNVLGQDMTRAEYIFAIRLLVTPPFKCSFIQQLHGVSVSRHTLRDTIVSTSQDYRQVLHLLAHRRASLAPRCVTLLQQAGLQFESAGQLAHWSACCLSTCTLGGLDDPILSVIVDSTRLKEFLASLSALSWPFTTRTSYDIKDGKQFEYWCQFGPARHTYSHSKRDTESQKRGCPAKLRVSAGSSMSLITLDINHHMHESEALLHASMSQLIRDFLDKTIQAIPNVDVVINMLARQQKIWQRTNHPHWLPVCGIDARFFPSRKTVYNYVTRQQMSELFDKHNATALLHAVEQLNSHQSTVLNLLEIATTDNPLIPFKWVYQSKFMQYLMEKYGSTITCIDATYKTNSYSLPLFTLVTIDNSRQSRLMGYFIVQNEETDTIRQALIKFKDVNPAWNPKCVMLDKSAAEIAAVSSVFPQTKVLLCDFHRIQAMQREFSKLAFANAEQRKQALGDIHEAASVANEEVISA